MADREENERPAPDRQEAIDDAVAAYQERARSAADAATAHAKPAPSTRIPLLIVVLVLFGASAASAVFRIQRGRPQPPRELLVGGAALALERGADEVEALRKALGKLPSTHPGTEALTGLGYELLGEESYALSIGVGSDTIRLEVAAGRRTLSGPGADAYPMGGAE